MAINKSVNTFEGGLVRTDNPIKQPKGTYSFALNAVINDIVTDNTSLTNEKAFKEYFELLEQEYTILGWSWLGNEEYVLFVKSNIDQILLIDGARSTKKLIYQNNDLNFSLNYEIKATYRINYKNQRIVYFVDGLNDDRVINIDVDNTDLDIKLISLGADTVKPIIEATVLDNGGSVTSGQYFIGISYNLGDSFTTSISSLTSGISIASENYRTNDNKDFGAVDGEIIPVPTSKSISINIDGLDPNYSSYNITIVKSDNAGGTNVKVIKNLSITTEQYTYTGNEGEVDNSINLNQVIVDTIKYYASEAITQKDNRLLRGNSKLASTQVNFQEFANNIKIVYKIVEEQVFNDSDITTSSIESNNNSRPGLNNSIFKRHSISPSYLSNTANKYPDNKSFMRDEVYSFGVALELKDGTVTDVFHVPGRLPNVELAQSARGEYSAIPNSTWDTDNWESKNTALNDGTLGYWRSNETYADGYNYPTNGEKDSAGKSYIRHHKMPSDILEPLYRTEILGNPNANNSTVTYRLYKRNIVLSFRNVEIPEKYANIIKKIKFFYTPRDSGNKSILSKGLLQATSLNETKRQKQQAEGGLLEDRDVFEFISPDVNFKFKQNSLTGDKIKVNGIDKAYINYAGNVINPGSNNNHNLFSFNKTLFDLDGRRQRLITSFAPYLERVIPKSSIYSRDLSSVVYVDSNYRGSTGGVSLDFAGSQKTAVIKLQDSLIGKPIIITQDFSAYYPELKLPVGNESTSVISSLELQPPSVISEKIYFDTSYYVSIVSGNKSLYGKTESLKYVHLATSDVKETSPQTLYEVVGGDTYIDMHHFKKTYQSAKSPTDTFDYKAFPADSNAQGETIYEFGSTVFGSFMVETDLNIRMRREGDHITEKYFPKSLYSDSSPSAYENLHINEEFYKIEDSYNIQHLKYYFANLNKTDDYTKNTDGLRYSTRIVYSDKQELEDKFDNYRVARANNYRDLPLNRGPISLFFTKGNKLYTVTRDSLFDVFASNQTIKSENADNIVVGTGEFLSIEPQELISIDGGYGGSSSKFSLVESPFGYLFVDRKKNKCLLFDDKFRDINILGLNENFKLELYKQFPELETDNGFDSPVANVGIISVYDPKLQRFIITKKDYRVIDQNVSVVDGKLVKDGSEIDLNDIDIAENKSFTISFSPIKDKWISYHTYIPKLYLPHETDFIKFDRTLDISNSEELLNNFTLELIVNDNPLYTKTFDSISTNLESYDISGNKTNSFFDQLLVYNEQQSSGNIILNGMNVTKKEKDWNINKFLDKVPHNSTKRLFSTNWDDKKYNYYIDKVVHNLVQDSKKPWFQMGRFRDKYLIIRFTAKDLDNIKIIVNFVNTTYRVSTR